MAFEGIAGVEFWGASDPEDGVVVEMVDKLEAPVEMEGIKEWQPGPLPEIHLLI